MLVTPPVLEPLTLAEAKLLAGLDWADGDPREPMLLGFVAAARSLVERDTGVALLTQTHAVSLARAAGNYGPFVLPWRPVQSIVIATLDAESYVLDPSSVDPTPARVTLVSGAWGEDLVATIVVGLTTVALLKAHAPGLVHAVGLLTAHYATVGRDLATVGTIIAETIQGYEDAVAPYRLVVVP